MTKKKFPEIKRRSWNSETTYESLRAAESIEQNPTERPAELHLKHLHVAPTVFQWRDLQLTQTADDAHMRELVRVLLDSKAPLDPLLVAPIGAKFFIIDGHHRFDAYHTVDWKRPVPVEYFGGSLREAQIEALRRNSKNKLPITPRDKFEAAWRLLRQGGEASQASIAQAATIARRTVSTMAKVLKDHPQAGTMTWREARKFQWDNVPEGTDDWRLAKAQKLASQWAKNLPPNFAAHADIVAMALEILNADFPRQLVHYWTGKDGELLSEMEVEFGL